MRIKNNNDGVDGERFYVVPTAFDVVLVVIVLLRMISELLGKKCYYSAGNSATQ